MQAKVKNWGNSLAVRIPKAFADEIGLTDESLVELKLEADHIILTPVRAPKYNLDDLVAKITDDNVHGEVDTGGPVGNEVW